jgi:hypothetical protein
MRAVKILIVKPSTAGPLTGNDVTMRRWAHILRGLGHIVDTGTAFEGQPADLLIAMHAYYSHGSIARWRAERPGRPAILALTGTDLYRDLADKPEPIESIDAATLLVALQPKAAEALPEAHRGKVRVIYQSAIAPAARRRRDDGGFRVCAIGHMRPLKDPLRAAAAARRLPADSRIEVLALGRAMTPEMERAARDEEARNPRFRWLGERSHAEALDFLAG